MTLDEWREFRKHLIPGCTFLYKGTNKSSAVIIDTPKGIKASFTEVSWEKSWDILGGGGEINKDRLFNFCWPDGSSMELSQVYTPPTKQELVIAKCKSLDQRFKNGSLPKTKAICCTFPDKQELTPERARFTQEELGRPEGVFYTTFSTTGRF